MAASSLSSLSSSASFVGVDAPGATQFLQARLPLVFAETGGNSSNHIPRHAPPHLHPIPRPQPHAHLHALTHPLSHQHQHHHHPIPQHVQQQVRQPQPQPQQERELHCLQLPLRQRPNLSSPLYLPSFPLPLPLQPDHPPPHQRQFSRPAMAAFPQQPNEEMQRQQELAASWQPEPTGPLVSQRLSSSAITVEYANADPIYRAKTASLPQKYAQYRTCRGDGLCGWRAVAFCYFETLLRLGVRAKFEEEEARLRALDPVMHEVGFHRHQYEDFADDMYDLLRESAASLNSADGGAALLRAFNDSNRSMSILTYIKTLTSAWIQTHPGDYAAFVSEPLRTYCATNIEPTVSEIEHVGMCGLVDMLLKPAGIAIEILYLDRTPGDEANKYDILPVDHSGIPVPNAPTIRLLYRPGHYDILYKLEDLPQRMPEPVRQDIIVALNHASPVHFMPTFNLGLAEYDIPGLSLYSGPTDWGTDQQFKFPATPAAPAPPQEVARTEEVIRSSEPVPKPNVVRTPTYHVPIAPAPSPSTLRSTDYQAEGPTAPQRTVSATPVYEVGPSGNGQGRFRPSVWEYETSLLPPPPPIEDLCETRVFKNSCYNKAHYNNPAFAPEQWRPDNPPGHPGRKKLYN